MTPVQAHPHPTNSTPAASTSANGSGSEAVDEAGPQVWGGMTVEVALSVMASARVGHLLLCDEDGRGTGLVTRAQLTAARDDSSYTDRVRLHDILGGHGTGASPVTMVAGTEHAIRHGRSGALPVADGQGRTTGVLSLSR
ncbi:CBS domain-containing protein [Streptomyces sp. NPDC045431]|uniref:CBS domain-containing protein n=1 Tax=Streptomyces sp. NPDC045431 TaxID=3155613 RepID=UPI0033D19682